MTETRQLPQPREGITGTPRPDDPVLSSQEATDLVGNLARHFYKAVIYGARPGNEAFFQCMIHPVPGDLVVVMDSLKGNEDDRWKGVGYLIAQRLEWATTDERWELDVADGVANPDLPRLTEPEAWYVQYGPEPVDVCRWVNCDVIAIPQAGQRWDR